MNKKMIFGKLMIFIMLPVFILPSCNLVSGRKIPVIFDTDANNEVDDQHALAYLLFNGKHFDVEGITVNATSAPTGYSDGSDVRDHYEEAKRILQLCGDLYGKIPLLTGANGSYEEIRSSIDAPEFDGHEAVDFIIERAMAERNRKLVLLAVGKLTNIALALRKEPAIANNIRIVWLGSNYPKPGEHNQDWDIESMNYILDVNVPFEMVTVRYGDPSGTSYVIAYKDHIMHRMPGKGPEIENPVIGRNGGEFTRWGDYSAHLFDTYSMHGNPPGRALFDMAAVAIVKNENWAESKSIPAPVYLDNRWVERPNNPREIIVWEWFDVHGILNDFFITMDDFELVKTK